MSRVTKKKFTPEINKQLIQLHIKNNYTNFAYIFMDWGIIIGSAFLATYYNSWPTYLLAIILIGSRMRAFENLLHNGSHGMLFKNRKLNDLMTRLFCAYPIFLSFNLYKVSHMQHHKWLGDAQHDPDLIRYMKLGLDKMPYSKPKMLYTIVRMFCWIDMPKYIYGNVAYTILNKDENNELIPRLLFLAISVILFVYFFSFATLCKFWLIPYLTTFQIIRYLAEISEHGGLYCNTDKEVLLARNNTDHLMSFFIYPHSDNYHLTHHLFPSITHYKMAEAHKIMMQDNEYQNAHNCNGYFINFASDQTTFDNLTKESVC